MTRSSERSKRPSGGWFSPHALLCYCFIAGAIRRLAAGCATGRPPSDLERHTLATLVLAAPLSAWPQARAAPPRWRGIFVTSIFTSFVVAAALALGPARVWVGDRPHALLLAAWAASALQFSVRCVYYEREVADAQRCGEREAFFSMCCFSVGGLSLPCTILNQAYIAAIVPMLASPAGMDLALALALSDFACVFQLFLARRGRFPTRYFVDGATVLSGAPGAAVFGAFGHPRCSLGLCAGLALWLGVAHWRDSPPAAGKPAREPARAEPPATVEDGSRVRVRSPIRR